MKLNMGDQIQTHHIPLFRVAIKIFFSLDLEGIVYNHQGYLVFVATVTSSKGIIRCSITIRKMLFIAESLEDLFSMDVK